MVTKFPQRQQLNLVVQQLYLRKLFPNADTQIRHSELIWIANIIPSPLSQTYKVKLNYKLKSSPKVKVLKPEFTIPEGEKLPHIYSGNYLCLFYPGSSDWQPDIVLAKTIIPWISEWLLHYEIWIATGKWCGGGFHPRTREEKKNVIMCNEKSCDGNK